MSFSDFKSDIVDKTNICFAVSFCTDLISVINLIYYLQISFLYFSSELKSVKDSLLTISQTYLYLN